jgi:hypothetical protein
MFGHAIGEVLPFAGGVALSPFEKFTVISS